MIYIHLNNKFHQESIYNSKVPTTSFLDYKNGWDHDPVRYFDGQGDGSVPVEGIR